MKSFFEFDFNEPDDLQAHLRCIKALDMALVLWDLDQYLRSIIKYSEEEQEDYQKVRDKLHELLGYYGVDLDKLIS